MAKLKIASSGAELKALLLSDEDGFRSVPQAVIQETLEAEMTEALQAHKGERAGARLVPCPSGFDRLERRTPNGRRPVR